MNEINLDSLTQLVFELSAEVDRIDNYMIFFAAVVGIIIGWIIF